MYVHVYTCTCTGRILCLHQLFSGVIGRSTSSSLEFECLRRCQKYQLLLVAPALFPWKSLTIAKHSEFCCYIYTCTCNYTCSYMCTCMYLLFDFLPPSLPPSLSLSFSLRVESPLQGFTVFIVGRLSKTKVHVHTYVDIC